MKAIALILFSVVALSSANYVRNRLVLKTTEAPAPEEVPEVAPQVPVRPAEISREAAVAESSYSRHPPARTYGATVAAGEELEHDHHESEEDEEAAAAREAEDERINEEQAKSAKYSFASAVDDGIMDHSHVRQESRDGLKVTGSYSYSDGFFRRTVNYEADENGYRVISEHSEPIGTGPNVDRVNGKADVHTQVGGVETQYSINADEILMPHQPINSTVAPTLLVKDEQSTVQVRGSNVVAQSKASVSSQSRH